MLAKLVEKNEYFFQRFFEIMLGLSTLALLSSPLLLWIFFPKAVVYLLTFLTVYWSYMAFRHTYGMYVGYKRYQREIAISWYDSCLSLDFSKLPDKKTLPESLNDLYHLILIPLVSEP